MALSSGNCASAGGSTAPDCVTCGACCAWSETWPVLIGERDGEGIPDDLIDADNRRMQSYGHRCAALDGKIGCQVACSVYANRPLVCREFQAGSEDCLMVRRGRGLDPAAA